MKYLGEKSTDESIVDKAYVDAESVHYGECSTAAATQAKAVTVNGVTALTAGVSARVKFANAQTYNGAPTLNVNGLGAKNIRRNGTTNAARYEWLAGEVLDLVYDGTAWQIVDGGIATTTYYGQTKLYTGAASTSAALALTPASLNNLAQNMIAGAPVYSASSTYAVGDRVRNGYYIYECNTAITTGEAWNAAHWTQLDSLQEQIDAIGADIPTKLSDLTNDEDFRGIKTGDNDPTTSDIEDGEVYLKFGTPTDYGPEIEELQSDVADLQSLLGETKRASGNPASFYTEKPNGQFTKLEVSMASGQSGSGYSGIILQNCKKNMCPPPVIGTKINSTTGVESDGNIGAPTDYIPVDFSAYESYCFSGIPSGVSNFAAFYNAKKQWLGRSGSGSGGGKRAITASSATSGTASGTGDIAYVRLYVYTASDPTILANALASAQIQLEPGDTGDTTAYEAYDGNIYSIDFPSTPGTVYNGTIDLATGELTVTDTTPETTYQLAAVQVHALMGQNNLSGGTGTSIDLAYTAGLADEVAALQAAMPVIKYGTATPTTATIGPGEFYFQIS